MRHSTSGTITVTNGNDTTVTVTLTPKATLYAATLAHFQNNQKPVLGAIFLLPTDNPSPDPGAGSEGILLASGYVFSTFGSVSPAKGLSWQGEQPLGEQPSLRIYLRNDTANVPTVNDIIMRYTYTEETK